MSELYLQGDVSVYISIFNIVWSQGMLYMGSGDKIREGCSFLEYVDVRICAISWESLSGCCGGGC